MANYKVKLYLKAPRRYWELLKPYCDGFVSEIKTKGFKTINSNHLDIISYSNRDDIYPKNREILYFHSDLDYLYTGHRNNLALELAIKLPNYKFGMFNVSSLDEIKVFNDSVQNKLTSIITWWPVGIGLQGRTLEENWPQLIEPKEDAIAPSAAWLEYNVRRFREYVNSNFTCAFSDNSSASNLYDAI